MNMQALMKQAQAMQKDITNIKNEIDSSVFEGKSSLVTVSVKGTKEVVSVKIDSAAKDLVSDDKTRNSDILIVVESSKDVFLLEKMGNFNGYYHVLGGLISPFDDIGPSDINLNSLFDRVKNDGIKELIFVTKSGIEADTTVLYVKKILSDVDVVISRIANGIPVGADMDYIDSLTLESALRNRKEVLD